MKYKNSIQLKVSYTTELQMQLNRFLLKSVVCNCMSSEVVLKKSK